MRVNLRLWNIGQHVGGDLHRVQECPRCKLPGSQSRAKPSTFVHSFELTAERAELLDCCKLTRQDIGATEAARRLHAKTT